MEFRWKRIHAGRYEKPPYGIRRVDGLRAKWQTFELDQESRRDGGWMQSYWTLRAAKQGVAALETEGRIQE